MIYLSRAARDLLPLAAGRCGRGPMSCLRIRRLPEGRYRLEATDGRALAVLRGPSTPTPLDLKAARSLPVPELLSLESLVPAADLRKAYKALPRDRSLGVLLGDPVLLAAGEDLLRIAPDPGRFPATESVLTTAPALVSIRVNPELLVALVKAAAAVAETGDVIGVELLWWGRDKPLGIIAQGAGGLFFDGILMPIT